MKLITKQLKTFNSIAGGMKQNNVLPILSYLKFDDGYITKNNLESFVTMEADFKGKFLIDEKILMSFVESTNAEEIDVKIDGTSVVISHGKEKMVSPTDDVANFPSNSIPEIKEIEIPSEVIDEIKIASNFTTEVENMPYSQCVFIGNGLVAATTGFVAYTKKVEDELPQITLGKNAASAIRSFNSVSFSENETYQFFTNHIFRFGFIKNDTKFVDMRPFAKVPNGESVKIEKGEIIRFCDTCVKSCPSRVVMASIKEDKLSMIDSGYGIDYEKPLVKSMPNFTFNPAILGKMLKSLPDETLTFSKADNKFYVTGESGFVSLIMEMQSSN